MSKAKLEAHIGNVQKDIEHYRAELEDLSMRESLLKADLKDKESVLVFLLKQLNELILTKEVKVMSAEEQDAFDKRITECLTRRNNEQSKT